MHASSQYTRPGLNVGFDFATILSSLVLSCILFDTVSEQLAELKMLILNRTCEIALCQFVCELVFGVNLIDSDFLGPG